nr:hypothetical protein [Aliagarivorans marinus]
MFLLAMIVTRLGLSAHDLARIFEIILQTNKTRLYAALAQIPITTGCNKTTLLVTFPFENFFML